MPRPLVPRELRFPVPGRTLANGATLAGHDLDEAYVERLAGELVDNGHRGGGHRLSQQFCQSGAGAGGHRAAVLRAARDFEVALSSDVVPEIREAERTSTTVANVYVQARVERYLRDLEERSGATRDSRGALLPPDLLRRAGDGRDRGTLSGSAPGERARPGGHWRPRPSAPQPAMTIFFPLIWGAPPPSSHVIDRGEPLLAHGFEVDRRYRFKKGSGLPINLPVIEMIEIGAGGGSIARIDALGLLKVGPDSRRSRSWSRPVTAAAARRRR